jgi:hypothetical protein
MRRSFVKLDKKFYVSGAGGDIIPPTIRKVKNDEAVPDDEWVLFMPKDDAFAMTLPTYLENCRKLGADEVQIALIKNLIEDVFAWRKANPDRCKVPDAKGEKVLA